MLLLCAGTFTPGESAPAPAPTGSPGPALEFWLAPSAPFWTWTAEQFREHALPLGFRWLDEGVNARAAPLVGTVFGQQVGECLVQFEDGVPDAFRAYYYNRGDSAGISEEQYKSLVRTLGTTISKTLHRQAMPGNNQSRQAIVRDDSLIWQLPTLRFELSYSYTPPNRNGAFRAEYVKLTVSKFKPGEIPASAYGRVNVYEVKANVVRDDAGGDVYIDHVPMVDQGEKGYCAAATSERVLRYFGQDVDQHEVAQLANTTAGGGTSFPELESALRAVGRQYGFGVNVHIDWNYRDFERDLKNYNREAKKRGGKEIDWEHMPVIDLGLLYSLMDTDTLIVSKAARKSDLGKFETVIQKYVNGGCPLAWGCMVGLVQENPPITSPGGHLRLIIGYNPRTRELLYTDSWGRGHAMKRMDLNAAFAITNGLLTLEPKGLRL